MKGRVRWGHVTIALALIAAVAVAAPAIGGQSGSAAVTKKLKNLVKKEVAKQIGKAKGPAGANGTNGTNGTNGVDGTARAYARVTGHAFVSCTLGPFGDECSVNRSKGVGDVIHPSVGVYCVEAPGISPSSVPAAVTVEFQGTSSPEGNASAMWRIPAAGSSCPSGWFEVHTERHGATTDAAEADTVSFTIVIP